MLKALKAGQHVLLFPGGIYEQMHWSMNQEYACFSRKRGFVKIAMAAGVPLVPGYVFGENQVFVPLTVGKVFSDALLKVRILVYTTLHTTYIL